jgi:hypothetical protein
MFDDLQDLDDDARKKLKMVVGVSVAVLVMLIALYFISDMVSSPFRREHRREPERTQHE